MTERYRSRTVVKNVTSTFVDPHSSYGGAHTFNLLEEMTDVVTPNYRELVRTGQVLPVNPVTQTKMFIEGLDVSAYTVYGGNGALNCSDTTGKPVTGVYTGVAALDLGATPWGARFPSLPTWGYADNLATADQLTPEALAEARSSNWDVLTFLAEMRKTVDLVHGFRDRVLQRANRVTKALHRKGVTRRMVPRSASNAAVIEALRRKADRRVHNAFLDVFYESWMEDRYGWRIFLYDLEAMQEAFLKLKYGMKGRITRGSAEALWLDTVSSTSTLSVGLKVPGQTISFPPVWCGWNQVATAHRKVGIGYENAFSAVVAVDPLVTLLELAKFSFVADWFTNLGDAVRAYSPFGAGSVVWYYETTEVALQNTYRCWPLADTLWYSIACPQPSGSVTLGRLRRQRAPLNWDDHRFQVRWYNELDLMKVVDIIALLRGIARPLAPWLRA